MVVEFVKMTKSSYEKFNTWMNQMASSRRGKAVVPLGHLSLLECCRHPIFRREPDNR
jgi:hypothetical protein